MWCPGTQNTVRVCSLGTEAIIYREWGLCMTHRVQCASGAIPYDFRYEVFDLRTVLPKQVLIAICVRFRKLERVLAKCFISHKFVQPSSERGSRCLCKKGVVELNFWQVSTLVQTAIRVMVNPSLVISRIVGLGMRKVAAADFQPTEPFPAPSAAPSAGGPRSHPGMLTGNRFHQSRHQPKTSGLAISSMMEVPDVAGMAISGRIFLPWLSPANYPGTVR